MNGVSSVRPVQIKLSHFAGITFKNESKAAGLDIISRGECADLIYIPIRDIFHQSISQGIFPDDWKCARVAPLFKKSDQDDLNNYRPILVISVMAKVFERIVYLTLNDWSREEQ